MLKENQIQKSLSPEQQNQNSFETAVLSLSFYRLWIDMQSDRLGKMDLASCPKNTGCE